MNCWLSIYSTPPVHLIADAAALDHLPAGDRVEQLLLGIGAIGGDQGENPSLAVRVRNDAGQAAALFGHRPGAVPAELRSAGGVLFAGLLTGIELDDVADLRLEAGSAIAWTSAVPLRRTTVWPGFATDKPIPHLYGQLTAPLIQYSSDRRAWVWADHVVLGIDEVFIDDAPAGSWEAANAVDVYGHPIALVTFSAPVPAGSTPTARGRGKPNARSGGLITNPADVIEDLLVQICGGQLTAGRLDQFRAECDQLGLDVGGAIAGGTVQAIVREICASVGAFADPLHPGLCQIHPGGAYVGTTWEVDGSEPGQQVRAVWARAAYASHLVLNYALELGETTETKRISRPVLPEVERVIELPWVRDERVALAIGNRLLDHWSRPAAYDVTVRSLRGIALPGDRLLVTKRTVTAGELDTRITRVAVDRAAEITTIEHAE